MAFDQKAYLKEWRAKNKAKCQEYRKTAKQKATPEERAAYQKAYREANKERLREQKRAYHEANREAQLERCRNYYEKNRDAAQAKAAAWYQENKDQFRASKREWYDRNRSSINDRARARYKDEVQFKLSVRLRVRLNGAIRKGSKGGSAVALLGCTVDQLVAHIEAQFQPGMTWRNWSKTGWHIDHIRPLAAFDLTDPEQVSVACHYTNLRPMWAAENMSKGKREPEHFSP